MPHHNWAPLAQNQPMLRYTAGQLIYLQDTEPTHFYYLISGKARSFISSEAGGERTLTLHQAGDLMGEASFFDQCPRVSSCMAVKDCKAVSIDRETISKQLMEHPELALPMLQHLASTVRTVTRHVDDMSFLRADQRVARYLLSLPDSTSPLSCTHEEIGFAIGVTRVTVSRVLARFVKEGWVCTSYRGVTLLDKGALQVLAGQPEA